MARKKPENPQEPLIGAFTHKVDVKWRVAVPKPLIRKMPEDQQWAIMGVNNHLILVPLKALFNKAAAGEENLAQTAAPFCYPLKLDSAGRFMIPQELRERLGIHEDEHVVVAGCYDHIQVWPERRWKSESAARMKALQPLFGRE